MHAGMYAATLHLMKGMAQTKSAADGQKLIDAMKAIPTDDPLFGKGQIQPTVATSTDVHAGDQDADRIEGRLGLFQGDRRREAGRRLAPARQGRLPLPSKRGLRPAGIRFRWPLFRQHQ